MQIFNKPHSLAIQKKQHERSAFLFNVFIKKLHVFNEAKIIVDLKWFHISMEFLPFCVLF